MSHALFQDLWKAPIRGGHKQSLRMGIEAEIFAYDSGTLIPLGLPGARLTSQQVLERIASVSDGAKLKRDDATNEIIGVILRSEGNFSIEPGGQIEYSSAPMDSFELLASDFIAGMVLMEEAFPGQILFASHGTNPLGLDEMPLLVPKERYLALSRFFEHEPNGRGLHMSRHTATVQPNLDIDGGDLDWNDAVNLSYVLTPFAKTLFSNSRYFKGKESKFESERQEIWRHTDPGRSGIPSGVVHQDDIGQAYANWASRANVLFINGLALEQQPLFGTLTFQQWLDNGYLGKKPSLQDWETHLGTVFPDVRLRGFLEIRMVDAQPFEHTLAPVAFWSGLLQSVGARRRATEFMGGVARTYFHCMGHNLVEKSEKPLSHAKDVLMHSDPSSAVFRDKYVHNHLLNIAIDALAERQEVVGVNVLIAFKGFLAQRDDYWKATDARTFVQKIGTLKPSVAFARFLKLDAAPDRFWSV